MKLSLAELQVVISSYVAEAKLSSATFSVTRDNTVGLLDKIAKTITLDSNFSDKLPEFDGEDLPLGKTLEEWQADLILPEDYDPTGANNMAPHNPTYRPAFYSYTLGEKSIPTTIRNNDIERAVGSSEELIRIVDMKTKRLYDSEASFKYGVKREMLAKWVAMCETAQDVSTSFSASGDYAVGTYLKGGSNAYIVVKAYVHGTCANYGEAVTEGYLIKLELVEELAVPADTATGEAFVGKIKEDVEKASDISEGHSLNGNTLGAVEGLMLIVKQGVMPVIESQVEAGAFNLGKIAIPAEVRVIKDFGSNATGVYAMLIDKRACRLHNTYRAVREDRNGKGDFLNLYLHTENTGFISRNAFVKVFKIPE